MQFVDTRNRLPGDDKEVIPLRYRKKCECLYFSLELITSYSEFYVSNRRSDSIATISGRRIPRLLLPTRGNKPCLP